MGFEHIKKYEKLYADLVDLKTWSPYLGDYIIDKIDLKLVSKEGKIAPNSVRLGLINQIRKVIHLLLSEAVCEAEAALDDEKKHVINEYLALLGGLKDETQG